MEIAISPLLDSEDGLRLKPIPVFKVFSHTL